MAAVEKGVEIFQIIASEGSRAACGRCSSRSSATSRR